MPAIAAANIAGRMSETEKWSKLGNNKKAVIRNADMSGKFLT